MLKALVKQILSEMGSDSVERHPKNDVIVGVIERMRLLIFPEYLSVSDYGIENRLTRALEYVVADLKSQGVPEETVNSFILGIPKLRQTLKTDLEAMFEGDPAAYNRAEIVISYPGLFAIMVQRMAHLLYLAGVPLIPRMMAEHAHSVTGIDIHPGADIGEFFCIDHGTGVVIGETTTIGNHVKIYQGVTLGALSTRGGQNLKGVKRHPTLQDYVTVYSGASILGGDTVIGEGVTIGSNAFVTKSVPLNTRVSVKNPELQFKNGVKKEELEQTEFWDYVI